jgi:Peptidase family M1 domain
MFSGPTWILIKTLPFFLIPCGAAGACAPLLEQAPAPTGKALYTTLKAFQLSGKSAVASNLTLQRDRAQMIFNGDFYFETPVAGKVYGAVFIGHGNFRAEPPSVGFERENVRRLLHADDVESDFQTAVLRFTDDTYQAIAKNLVPPSGPITEPQQLAAGFEPQFLKETGVNVSARLAVSVLDEERPGFFIAQFDKGTRGRFTFAMDYQQRVPGAGFDINGGEKGIIFAHNPSTWGNDTWMAFYSLEDQKAGHAEYSDVHDLVTTESYQMDVDLHDATNDISVRVRMQLKARADGLLAIPFQIDEDLPEMDSMRLKRAMRLTAAFQADGKSLGAVQEDWEGGVTVFLPGPVRAGEEFALIADFKGNFMEQPTVNVQCYYPLATIDWYPRHGYLNRSTYDLIFHHRKNQEVVSVGRRVREKAPSDADGDSMTEYRTEAPIALASFAVGDFVDHTDTAKIGKNTVSLSLFAPKGGVKEDFVLAEMGNCLRFFSSLFGPYQYNELNAVYFPENFGQGLPTLLLLPKADLARKQVFQFIAHETSHQWWGDMITWRSYRDQWLSEGFADYSGILYAARRKDADAEDELVKSFREELDFPVVGELGLGKGPVAEVGPLILGHRLSSRATRNGYFTLIYKKGALVLRMLNFLFTDPQTGNGQAFFDMMSDFVSQHRNGWASTEDFIRVANAHFAATPIAREYGMDDLNWFFQEWVYAAYLPTYRLEYRTDSQPDGSVLLHGTLYQDDTPQQFIMPLPLVIHFGKEKTAITTVLAAGPQQPFSIRLPMQPSKVELDPQLWVLSKKTSEKKLK